jgi:hypothetical protein
MGSTPVGYLYTPQQLAGSVRYGTGVLLGNWREDNELHDKRMMDYIEEKESMSLTLLKKQGTLGPQLVPAQLSPAPADGIMRYGDVVLVKSECHGGALAVSLGQKLVSETTDLFGVFGTTATEAMARNAIKLSSFDGIPDGKPILYGQKVVLEFSDALPVKGFLSSMRSGRSQLSTQLINKQEVFMQSVTVDRDRSGISPIDCAWTIHPASVDDRIIAQNTEVLAGAPFVLKHHFTNKCLAGVHLKLPTDFGKEAAICAHTYTEAGKVNKLMRETRGQPTNSLISRSETDENLWTVLYA